MIRIDCAAVSKRFYRHSGRQLLRHHARSWFSKQPLSVFWALRGVTFQVASGESVGVIGHNGAGKSTLLSMLTGLAAPDEGRIAVNGRVAALLELGSGFHADLTGAENLLLNAALLGMHEKETRARFDEIVAFAELADFIYEPLRTWSSGMILRLAFSIAVILDPDILIVDEILAVGDHAFQKKCLERIMEFRRSGKTILAVSHSPVLLQALCSRGIWLDHGALVMDDSIDRVLSAYSGQASALSMPS